MGLQFGSLPIRIRRVLYYSLTPLEQRLWAKSMAQEFPSLVDKHLQKLPWMLPSFIMTAVIYKWAPAAHRRNYRKDPTLYENDK